MSEVLHWLYSTIPFIQVLGNRFNILGLFWFFALTILTYKCLKDSGYSFGVNKKHLRKIGLLGISILTIWIFYRMLDEILTIFTVLSWDPELLTLSNKAFIFWIGKGMSYSIVLLGLLYLFNHLKINKFFERKFFFTGVLFFVLLIQYWSVGIFKVDYAVLEGLERIQVFWSFYPILYISYAVLYYSVFKGRIKI